jgi:hypothetical protein
MTLYKIGQRVDRIQDNDPKGAVIISIQERPDFQTNYELLYDEGGSGWWTEDSIKPIN